MNSPMITIFATICFFFKCISSVLLKVIVLRGRLMMTSGDKSPLLCLLYMLYLALCHVSHLTDEKGLNVACSV